MIEFYNDFVALTMLHLNTEPFLERYQENMSICVKSQVVRIFFNIKLRYLPLPLLFQTKTEWSKQVWVREIKRLLHLSESEFKFKTSILFSFLFVSSAHISFNSLRIIKHCCYTISGVW